MFRATSRRYCPSNEHGGTLEQGVGAKAFIGLLTVHFGCIQYAVLGKAKCVPEKRLERLKCSPTTKAEQPGVPYSVQRPQSMTTAARG
jgi:hypothetical protein